MCWTLMSFHQSWPCLTRPMCVRAPKSDRWANINGCVCMCVCLHVQNQFWSNEPFKMMYDRLQTLTLSLNPESAVYPCFSQVQCVCARAFPNLLYLAHLHWSTEPQNKQENLSENILYNIYVKHLFVYYLKTKVSGFCPLKAHHHNVSMKLVVARMLLCSLKWYLGHC